MNGVGPVTRSIRGDGISTTLQVDEHRPFVLTPAKRVMWFGK